MNRQSLTKSAMTLVLVSLCGCVLPRSRSALSNKDCPIESVAVLPVEISPSVSEEEYAHDDLRELGNRVLNTLTKAADDNLLGPKLVMSKLADGAVPESLRWHEGYGDDEIEPAILSEYQDISQRLGTDLVIRSSLAVFGDGLEAMTDTGTLGATWGVGVSVRMQLLDLETGRVCRRSYGSGDAGGFFGVLGGGPAPGFLPFYFDSTLGRGVDQAFREAFREMYRAEKQKNPAGKPSSN